MDSLPFATTRLTGLLLAVGVATSRVGLLVHELLGHGAVALAFGGSVTDVKLFWFAGGWVHYRLEPDELTWHAALLGGIAVEVVIGIALWLALARRTSIAARIVRALGATLAAHGFFYLSAGTFHGFGDGALLHRELGSGRVPLAIAAGALSCTAAFLGARHVLATLAATLPATRGRRIAAMTVAVALAGGLQLGAALGEVRVRRDDTYGKIMKTQAVRVTEEELAAWLREQQRRGIAVDAAAREARARELAERHRDFPFAIVLGGALVAAVAAGAWRSRSSGSPAISHRMLATAGAIAAGSLAAVIAIDAAFH